MVYVLKVLLTGVILILCVCIFSIPTVICWDWRRYGYLIEGIRDLLEEYVIN